ncbi:TraB/GumN family protein [Hyalangium gracile]|uniref:hypothetical protein n=1 Tax=Hyalangium gracile TaxID=394092 RepID=UPI001CCBC370|nr:hypothetical protein [Hyalangium gracile]
MDHVRRLLLLVLVSATACRSASPKPATAESPPPPPVTTAAEPAKVEPPCADGFIDLERWLSEGLLVLGEYHGTEELPRAVAETVCAAAANGKSAWLALELPRDEQPRIDAFLAAGNEAPLLEGPFWRRDYQDGRSSQAMLGLLREVRRMRSAGRDVRVLAYDIPSTGGTAGEDRDAQMAAFVAQARTQAPAEPMVLLVGNIHATRRLKIPRSMVWHLVKLGVPLKTLNVASRGGTAWMCGATCGVAQLAGEDLGPDRRVLETPEAAKAGYDGLWYVGTVTASPPAWKKP